MSHLQFFDYEGYGQRYRKEMHFSQAVRIGDTVECSGQSGRDRTTEDLPGDLEKQIGQAFANVEHALKQAGSKGWDQVYKVRCYCAPLNEEAGRHIVRNLKKYCPNHEPLLTVLGVERLYFDDMRIEIEAGAHLGS